MRARKVIEIQAESYIEEQLIMESFPEAIFLTEVGGVTRFFLPYDRKEEVVEKLKKLKG
jgi:hypothetical protein